MPFRKAITASVEARKMANAEVGDFISDLMIAIKYKTEYDLHRGQLLVDPVRGFTDGRAFAQEYASDNHGKLRVSLTLDTSRSMFGGGGPIEIAAPVFHKMDTILREAAASLPFGTLKYQPFIFHTTAHRIPKAYIPSLSGGSGACYPTEEQLVQAKAEGEVPESADTTTIPLMGGSTYLSDAFTAIQQWEQTDPDYDGNAMRIDIVLTDGEFNPNDVNNTSRIQEERNGKLLTVLLNFNPSRQVDNNLTPSRATQYAVTADNLTHRIRTILEEGIAQL